MSNCQICFNRFQEEIIIQCQRDEIMKDILSRYGNKAGIQINEFYFLYNGKKIDPNKKLSQLNNKDSKIQILVYKEEIGKKNENIITKKSKYIKNNDSNEPAIIEFSDNYEIILIDQKNETKKIKLQDYDKTQIVNLNEIKCCNCPNTIAETVQEKFFYCFECKKNFCPICKLLHKDHKNIVDYQLKYFKCSQHQNQNFVAYCINCQKNLCIPCTNQHKGHNIIHFANLIQEIDQNKENVENIQKMKELVDNIINLLEKFKQNLDVYVQINEKLNENFISMNYNYELLKNMKNFNEMSFLKNDIKELLNKKNN